MKLKALPWYAAVHKIPIERAEQIWGECFEGNQSAIGPALDAFHKRMAVEGAEYVRATIPSGPWKEFSVESRGHLVRIVRRGGRGSGRTALQILGAIPGSLYVFVNENLRYPRDLARVLRREDITFVSPQWLENIALRGGQSFPAIMIDHAAALTPRQRDGLRAVRITGGVNAEEE